ncbi:MAG TPA: hypothetical protein VL633_13725 [Bacteroidota bacterium]|nr:hypothetical protein [Bacteroidota bacterium]
MQTRSIVHICVAFALIVSYGLTIPVLSTMHSHEIASTVKEISGARKVASKSHPLYCEICVRLQSTQTVCPQEVNPFVVQPKHEVPAADYETFLPARQSSSSQNRAPPVHLT